MKSREEILGALESIKTRTQIKTAVIDPETVMLLQMQAGINAPIIMSALGLILEVALDIRELAQGIKTGPVLTCKSCLTKMSYIGTEPTGYFETGWKSNWECPQCHRREEQAAPPPGSSVEKSGVLVIGPDAEPTDFRCHVRAVAFNHRHCNEYDDTDGNCLRLARGEKGCSFTGDSPPAIEVDDCGDPDAVREAARETLLRAQAEKPPLCPNCGVPCFRNEGGTWSCSTCGAPPGA